MKYIKDIIRVSLFVFIIYIPIVWYSIQNILDKKILEENYLVAQLLGRVGGSVSLLLKENRVSEVCQRLGSEYDVKNINSYRVISADQGECFAPQDNLFVPSETDYSVHNGSYYYRIAENGVDWMISVQLPTRIKFWNAIFDYPKLRESFLKDILIAIYIIFAFVLLAVLVFANSIQLRFKRQGLNPFWLRLIKKMFGFLQLQDLRILDLATKEIIQEVDRLEKDIDLLETSLEYSILNEIKQKSKTIPYAFNGTVAKVDINGFSKVIALGDKAGTQKLTQNLEQFGCELLFRYQGLFEKSIGDELVVVFKGKDSEKLAAAYCRDLMREFSEVEFDFNSGLEKRKFTLKSAISSSEIVFSKRMSGYGFSGDALTFTTRLMDVVQLKDRNILSILQSQASALEGLIRLPETIRHFEFKNMNSQTGYWIDQFKSIDDCYQNDENELIYFRSNSDIIYLFHKIQTEASIDKVNLILSCLSKISVRESNDKIIHAYIQSIILFEQKTVINDRFIISFTYLITEGARLIPPQYWNQACTDCLLSVSRRIDGRVNAAIVEVLIEKNLFETVNEHHDTFLFPNDQSYRTRGNLLINQALQSVDQDILGKIIQMMNSKIVLESHTGIYCACHISQYYQSHNPAELLIYNKHDEIINMLQVILAEGQARHNSAQISPRLVDMIQKTLSKYVRHSQNAI